MRLSVVLPVLAPTPFLQEMTVFTIKVLQMHADHEFELVVTEAGESESGFNKSSRLRIDKYLNFNPPVGGVRETNAAIDAASGDFVVSTGNDVIVPPHWDTELLRVFEERPKDCGAASLSAFEPGTRCGPPQSIDMIVEGFYSPFIMFRKGWRYDESFIKIYQDSDLILRMYESGLRVYRSCRMHVHHLSRMTSDRVNPEQHKADLARDEQLFYQRWRGSPLMMYAMIRSSQVTWGREWESHVREIELHHNPGVGS